MAELKPVPMTVVQQVTEYIRSERDAAEKWENREPLDDSGVYGLHALARDIYAAGWSDGYSASAESRRP